MQIDISLCAPWPKMGSGKRSEGPKIFLRFTSEFVHLHFQFASYAPGFAGASRANWHQNVPVKLSIITMLKNNNWPFDQLFLERLQTVHQLAIGRRVPLWPIGVSLQQKSGGFSTSSLVKWNAKRSCSELELSDLESSAQHFERWFIIQGAHSDVRLSKLSPFVIEKAISAQLVQSAQWNVCAVATFW